MLHIVFYDGYCGLCNRSVKWLIRHDRRRVLRYSSLQSAYARKALQGRSPGSYPDSIIFKDGEQLLTHSSAVIAILRKMKGIYSLAVIFLVLPRPFRDTIYKWVAKNRYRWFGRYKECPLPSPGQRELFLDTESY